MQTGRGPRGTICTKRAQAMAIALAASLAVGGCATSDGFPFGESQATRQGATGAAIGAVAGNVLGYMTDSDRTTTTVLGALVGGGLGYWRGLEADKRLEHAQTTSQEIAQVQQTQAAYPYEQPKLYAKEATAGGKRVATFDRLETPIPAEAIRTRSQDAQTVLSKLGALAARNGADITVYAPTSEAQDYMVSELRKGAGGARVSITTRYAPDARVVVEQIPSS